MFELKRAETNSKKNYSLKGGTKRILKMWNARIYDYSDIRCI